jgi:Flp pilus assembly protein TadG
MILFSINRFFRNVLKSRRGATAVEFAMVAPIFLIMVIGIFELGRAMWIKASMQYAVEETTRYAIVNTSATTSTLATYASTAYSSSGINITGATFTATQATTSGKTYVTISGSYSFSVIVPLVPIPDMTLSAKSRIPIS